MLGRCTTGPCRKYGLFLRRTPLCRSILPPSTAADMKRRRVPFLPRDLRIIGTGLRGNKVLCPRTRPHVHPQRDTLTVHSPSTDFTEVGGRKAAAGVRPRAR